MLVSNHESFGRIAAAMSLPHSCLKPLSSLSSFGSEDGPPLGPSTIEDMFLWCDTAWRSLDSMRQQQLCENVNGGIELLTFYSGKGSGESMMYQVVDYVLQAQWAAGEDDSDSGLAAVDSVLNVVSACDVNPVCRDVLQSLQGAKPKHVFGDINQRPAEAAKAAAEVYLPAEDADKSERAEGYERFADSLFSAGMAGFSRQNSCHCFEHQQECFLWEAIEDTDIGSRQKLVVTIAGSSCVDFSKRRTGHRPGMAGTSARPFFTFVAEQKQLQPDIIYIENVQSFPVSMFTELLPQYELHYVLVNPSDYGYPISRPRVFGMLQHKVSTVLEGSVSGFEQMFKKALNSDGDIFFTAPPADVLSAYEDRAKSRGNFLRRTTAEETQSTEALLNKLSLPTVVTCTTYQRLADCEKLRIEKGLDTGCFIIDLDQNAGFSQCGHLIPSVPTHFCIYSFRRQRLLTGIEALGCFGENIYHQMSAPASLLPLSKLQSLSERQLAFLAGNSWHIPLFGQFIMYTLSHLRKVLPAERGAGLLVSEPTLMTSKGNDGSDHGDGGSGASEQPLAHSPDLSGRMDEVDTQPFDFWDGDGRQGSDLPVGQHDGDGDEDALLIATCRKRLRFSP